MDSKCLGAAYDRLGASHCPPRPVEGGEEAVAECLDLAASKLVEVAAHEGIVLYPQVAPRTIADRRRVRG